MGYYDDRNVIFVNDVEKVFFVNSKYGDREFKGFRITVRLGIGQERHQVVEIKKAGYIKKYVGDFLNSMI